MFFFFFFHPKNVSLRSAFDSHFVIFGDGPRRFYRQVDRLQIQEVPVFDVPDQRNLVSLACDGSKSSNAKARVVT